MKTITYRKDIDALLIELDHEVIALTINNFNNLPTLVPSLNFNQN